ncbi:hypothetical protein D9M68_295130 [compost metagenome]
MRPSLAPLPLVLGLAPASAEESEQALQSESQALLIVGRARELPLNACDIGLFVENQLAARLAPGDEIDLPVPAGELSLGVAMVGSEYCTQSEPQVRAQSALLQAGETRRYQVAVDDAGVFLAPQE